MISIEPLRLEHAPALVAAAQESIDEVNPWLPWCTKEFLLPQATEWIASQAQAFAMGSAYEFAILGKGGEYLGGGGINSVNKDNNFANVGYWIKTSASKKGYATQALQALIEWGKLNTQLKRFEVVVAEANEASRRVAEKAGGQLEVKARNRLFLHGIYHDAYIFTFFRDHASRH